jgi:hypothetical protein
MYVLIGDAISCWRAYMNTLDMHGITIICSTGSLLRELDIVLYLQERDTSIR